ncbi:uncharacterized protein VTP21DRAFT_3387 [Calcarisporiella thermophila]|uniref:uncharacterized protein n=1 Tax=Calcarisporiella thermophila TaxID=911321 RepID=UPI003744291A
MRICILRSSRYNPGIFLASEESEIGAQEGKSSFLFLIRGRTNTNSNPMLMEQFRPTASFHLRCPYFLLPAMHGPIPISRGAGLQAWAASKPKRGLLCIEGPWRASYGQPQRALAHACRETRAGQECSIAGSEFGWSPIPAERISRLWLHKQAPPFITRNFAGTAARAFIPPSPTSAGQGGRAPMPRQESLLGQGRLRCEGRGGCGRGQLGRRLTAAGKTARRIV